MAVMVEEETVEGGVVAAVVVMVVVVDMAAESLLIASRSGSCGVGTEKEESGYLTGIFEAEMKIGNMLSVLSLIPFLRVNFGASGGEDMKVL